MMGGESTPGIPISMEGNASNATTSTNTTTSPVLEDVDMPLPPPSQTTLGEGDLPVEGTRATLTVDPAAQRQKKKPKWPIACVPAILLLVLIIGLAIGLTQARNQTRSASSASTGQQQSPTPVPIASPTTAPPPNDSDVSTTTSTTAARLDSILSFLLSNNYADTSTLDFTSSPQHQAAVHMAESAMEIPTGTTGTTHDFFLQRWVLLVLFYTTNGNDWLVGWNMARQDLDTCQWNGALPTVSGDVFHGGAFCNNNEGYVDVINLVANRLSGIIPTELALLTRLTWLSVERNEIGGDIPTELAALTNLQLFDVLFNKLSGPFPFWLDASFQDLRVLGLSNNLLEGSLPNGLANIQTLVSLAVDDNLLTGSVAPVESLTNLLEFYAEDNSFDFTLSFSTLANLASLRYLDLSNNELDGNIPSHFFQYANLTVLDLHGNLLSGTLPPIAVNSKLQLLALHRNSISGVFPPDIVNLQALSHLDLTSTNFDGIMPTYFGEMTQLEYLFLADTPFLPGPIPNEYSQLTLLQDLSLKNTNRNGPIPTWIGSMDRLLLLDLDSNNLSTSIPTEIGDMTSLVYLLLNRNSLTGTIPSELAVLQGTLQAATFDHNQLAGSAVQLCAAFNPPIYFTSDCDNATPVDCPCCVECCDPNDDDCHSGDLLGQLDPIWESGYERTQYFFYHYNITDRRQLMKVHPERMEEIVKQRALRGHRK